MGVHMFTKIKNADGWKHKKFFFSYFISEIPHFSYMRFYRKWAMFRWSIPLKGFFCHLTAIFTFFDHIINKIVNCIFA